MFCASLTTHASSPPPRVQRRSREMVQLAEAILLDNKLLKMQINAKRSYYPLWLLWSNKWCIHIDWDRCQTATLPPTMQR